MEYIFYGSLLLVTSFTILAISRDALAVFNNQSRESMWELVTVFFLTTLVCVWIPTAVVYHKTAGRQGVVNKQAPIIAHYQKYVSELEDRMGKIKGQNMYTFNADTPVAALVQGHMTARNKLLEAEKAIDQAKLEIEQTRLGFYGYVVPWVVGEK